MFGMQRHVKNLSGSTVEGANRARMENGNSFVVLTYLLGAGARGIQGEGETFRSV